MNTKKTLTLLAAIAFVVAGSHTLALAADRTWDGGGAGGNVGLWDAKQNWGNIAVPTSIDNAFFGSAVGSSSTPNVNVSGLAVNGITFNAGAASFTIGGANTLTIHGGGIANNALNTETINAPLALGADQTWQGNAGTLTIGGSLNLSTRNLIIDNAATVNLNGAVSGVGTLSKTGAGTLTLAGTGNNFSGGTTLSEGAITLGTANALGSGGLEFAGGILNANNQTVSMGALSLTANSTLNLSAGGVAGEITISSASWSDGLLTINNWTGILGAEGEDDRLFVSGTSLDVEQAFLDNAWFDVSGVFYPAMLLNGIDGLELVPSLTPVPEPTEWALIIFATLALLYKFAWPRLRGALARG